MSDGQPDGATPLNPDESEGLIPPQIATRAELNEAEEANIARGMAWALRLVRTRPVLTDAFVYELHRRMFDAVWEWAGRVRTTDKNIGIDKHQVRIAVRELMADAAAWKASSAYPPEEIAVRLHHRLVAIHPFANGNGRHARMMADLFLLQEGMRPMSWGGRSESLVKTGDLRSAYVSALRAADAGEIGPLLRFAAS